MADHVLATRESVTDEIIEMVHGIVDGWYQEGRIDWENVWDRLERHELANGDGIDIPSLDSPAQQEIKKRIRADRKNR